MSYLVCITTILDFSDAKVNLLKGSYCNSLLFSVLHDIINISSNKRVTKIIICISFKSLLIAKRKCAKKEIVF